MKNVLTISLATMGGFLTQSIGVPMLILLAFFLIDYVVGIGDAIHKKETFSVEIAAWGILRKLGSAVVVIIGILVDLLIIELGTTAHVEIPFTAVFATAATLYLCGTELFSILRHLDSIGVRFPKLFQKLVTFLTEDADHED